MTPPAPVDSDRLRRALRAAGQIGPYYVVRATSHNDYSATRDFYDPRRLRDLVAIVARRLGTDEPRVAASSLQYELAERLWSVVLGSWLLDGLVVDLSTLACQAAPNGRIRLYLPDPGAVDHRSVDLAQTATSITDNIVDGQLTALHRGLRSVTRVSEGLLWGNAAAALVLVAQNLFCRNGNDQILTLLGMLLASPPLANRVEGDITGTISRRTCCLYYRTAAHRTCGDCPLAESAVARSRT